MNRLTRTVLGVVIASACIAIGVFAARPAPVAAQAASYKECFFGQQEVVDINNAGVVETPTQNRLIMVPSGWTVVSGGGYEDGGIILFCR